LYKAFKEVGKTVVIFEKLEIKRNHKCMICGDNPKIKKLIDYNTSCD